MAKANLRFQVAIGNYAMNDLPWTIGRLLTWTTDFLRDKGADSPRLDAEVLLAHACGCPRIELYTTFDEQPDQQTRTTFRELVKRRSEGTPVAYLVGHREFFSLSFQVTPEVLIPRPETEQLVMRAIDLSKEMEIAHVADVGTGSGILAVCCVKYLNNCRVTAIDISSAALRVAAANAAKHGVSEHINFIESDLLAACPREHRFDLIVSNPPYVSTQELAELDAEIRNHEPQLALEGGEQGTEIIGRLLPQAAGRLNPGGWLLLEVSPMNVDRVRQLVHNVDQLELKDTILDLASLPRVVQAMRKE